MNNLILLRDLLWCLYDFESIKVYESNPEELDKKLADCFAGDLECESRYKSLLKRDLVVMCITPIPHARYGQCLKILVRELKHFKVLRGDEFNESE